MENIDAFIIKEKKRVKKQIANNIITGGIEERAWLKGFSLGVKLARLEKTDRWIVKRNEDNYKKINKIMNNLIPDKPYPFKYNAGFVSSDGCYFSYAAEGYTLITYEEFLLITNKKIKNLYK